LRRDTTTTPFGECADVVDPGILRAEQLVVILEAVRDEMTHDLVVVVYRKVRPVGA